jgi:hypothetical protein
MLRALGEAGIGWKRERECFPHAFSVETFAGSAWLYESYNLRWSVCGVAAPAGPISPPEVVQVLQPHAVGARRRACVVLWACVRRRYGRDVATCVAGALWAARTEESERSKKLKA